MLHLQLIHKQDILSTDSTEKFRVNLLIFNKLDHFKLLGKIVSSYEMISGLEAELKMKEIISKKHLHFGWKLHLRVGSSPRLIVKKITLYEKNSQGLSQSVCATTSQSNFAARVRRTQCTPRLGKDCCLTTKIQTCL